MPVIHRHGQRIAYDTLGGGPRAIVFAHNLFCDRRVFEFAAYALASRMRVINLDLRGHGESRDVREPFATRDLADDLCAVMAHEGLDRAVVAGLSLGATAAMQLALEHPARVEALVLIGATGRAARRRERFAHRVLQTLLPIVGFQGRVGTAVLRELFGATFRTDRPDGVREWTTRMAMLDRRDAVFALRAWSARPELLPRLDAIRAPALIITGEEDTACPPAEADALRAALGGPVRVERIRSAGHTLAVERPDETLAAIERFVDSLEP